MARKLNHEKRNKQALVNERKSNAANEILISGDNEFGKSSNKAGYAASLKAIYYKSLPAPKQCTITEADKKCLARIRLRMKKTRFDNKSATSKNEMKKEEIA